MIGCLKRFGCLLVLLIAAVLAVGWYFYGRKTSAPADTSAKSASATRTWQPMTVEGAARARTALQKLSAKHGPVFANIAPGDLASYIVEELSKTLPRGADSVEAAAIGDRLYLRARVKTSDLGGASSLGPLSALLGDRARIQLGGTIHVLAPGRAELKVQEIKLNDLNLPSALIPRLIKQISRGERPADIAANGIALQTPKFVGDVRVSDGRITVYKNIGQ